MKIKAGVLALMVGLPASLTVGSPALAAPAQTKISKCPYTITAPGKYLVQKNLSCSGTAITVAASNVDLDLGGHTLSGSGVGSGVFSQGQSSVTIHDGAVQGFFIGVELRHTLNGSVSNVTASQNTAQGISGRDGTVGLTVTGCTATQNGFGIVLDGDSRSNTVVGSTASSNAQHGVYVTGGAFANTIRDNTAGQNGFWGIAIDGGGGNTISGNTTNLNGDRGITLYTNGNRVESNTCDRNGNGGIDVAGNSQDNRVLRNSATGNGHGGIRLYDQTSRNTIQDNTISGSFIGIWLANGISQNTLQGNTANLNVRGIWLFDGAGGNTILSNTASSNREFDLADDNFNCDANTWSGNAFTTANQPCIQ
jgi:parallel beta-helix repeat protein